MPVVGGGGNSGRLKVKQESVCNKIQFIPWP